MGIAKKSVVIFLIFVLLSSVFSVAVFADEVFDENATGSIMIDYTYNSDPLDDVEFKVYYVATMTGNEEISLNENFADFPIEFTKLDSMEYWLTVRDNLENYIHCNCESIECDMSFVTDGMGQYLLEDLELGLYYIEAEPAVEDNVVFYSEPIMIFVGQYDDEDDKWLYHFDVTPKISVISYDPLIPITVTKVWENSDEEFVKAQEIEVQIYKDGEVYDTVILNEENSWTYTWYDMDFEAEYGFIETSNFEDYQVDYSHNIYEFTITNTYIGEDEPDEPEEEPDEPEEEPDEPEEEIPQTGSNANLIPIFAGIGLSLIAVGALLKYKGKSDES